MANEINININITARDGPFEFRRQANGIQADLGGRLISAGSIEVTTSESQIPLASEVDPPGWCWFRNISGGESPPAIHIGRNDGSGDREQGFTLMPGEACLLPLETRDWMAEAAAGTGILEFALLQRPS